MYITFWRGVCVLRTFVFVRQYEPTSAEGICTSCTVRSMIMKQGTKRLVSLLTLLVLIMGIVLVPQQAYAANEFYGDYTDASIVYDYGSCPSMQGLAVGSQMLYTVKIGSNDTKAFISMTDKDTGTTTKLYNSDAGSYYFDYLGHANDMDVWGIDGYSNIFVTSTNEGSNAIVRLKRSGNNLTKVASYSLTYNGAATCATALAIKSVSGGVITFITKLGMNLYTGSVSTSATSANIELTKLCTISKSRVYIKGEYLDLSNFVNQGFGYYQDTLYVPITGDDSQLNRSVIMVYDLSNASGTIYPTEALVFRVTSGYYSALFEIESCDICSGDGKLYFNTNRRRTNSDTNHDGVSSIDGYTFEKLPVDAPTSAPKYTMHYNANGGTGTMADTVVTYGQATKIRTNAFTRTGYTFVGWTAYRTAQDQWFYTNGTSSGWYKQGSQPSGYDYYVYRDQQGVSATSAVPDDVVQLYAQWEKLPEPEVTEPPVTEPPATEPEFVPPVRPDQEGVIVVAGSDFQNSNTDHGIAGGQVTEILNAMKAEGYTDIDGFLFGGDYSQAFTADATKAGLAHLQGVISEAYPNLPDSRKLWLQGNHDPDSLVTDGTLSASGEHDTDDYGVFLINEKDYMWYNNDQATVKTTAAILDSYLTKKAEAGYTKPIFIMSHLQLHYSMRTANDGDGQHANYLFDVINKAAAKGLNIIFLFGHNHSNGWDDYLGGAAVYLERGDSILIAQNSRTGFREETLNFTYLNAGYVGYYANVNTGSETDLTMTAFRITDQDVTVTRFTKNGAHDLKSTGVTNAYKSETAYTPDTDVYNSARTVKLSTATTVHGSIGGYLDRVESGSELERGVPYVISDYNDSWLQYALTSQTGARTSSGKTHKGFLLSGTAYTETFDLWYLKDGYFVYGSPDSDRFLKITYDASGQGQVTVGSFDADTAAYPLCYSGDDFIIRGTSGYFLNRRGGTATDFVATAYNSAGGSYWHLDRVVPQQFATLTATMAAKELYVGEMTTVDYTTLLDGVATDDADVTVRVSNTDVASVSGNHIIALSAGQVTVSVTLSAIAGEPLNNPVTVEIPLTVFSTDDVISQVQQAKLVKVSSLKTGVPYVLTEMVSGHALTGTVTYSTDSDYKGLNGTQGLKIVTSIDLEDAPVWYYTGTHLRYGSASGQYLIYNSANQVALGSLTEGHPFDKIVVYSTADKAFNLYPSGKTSGTTNYYLNQFGGSNYNAAGLYSSAYYSRWQFSQLLPKRMVALSVSPASSTVSAGSSLRLDTSVLVDGTETSSYLISYTCSDPAVATVSNTGVITGISSGDAEIIATLTEVDGRALDMEMSMKVSVTVTDIITVTGTQAPSLQAVNTLETGVPYVLSERASGHFLTGTMSSKTDSDYKGLSGTEGLKVVSSIYLTAAPVWYYTGTYLRYGSTSGQYLIYNSSNQVALGSLTEGHPFDRITLYSSSDRTFNLSPSGKSYGSTNYYLNQFGGANYNAAGLYSSAYYSRWQFNRILPRRELSITGPGSMTLLAADTATPAITVKADNVATTKYAITYSSSNSAVASVNSAGVIAATGLGNAVITLKLTDVNGRALEQPITMQIKVRVVEGAGYTASAVQPGSLTRVGSLKTGVPYVITERVSGHALTPTVVYINDSDYKGLSGAQGLKLVSEYDMRTPPMWYYDGASLRSNSPTGDPMIYNTLGQVATGSSSGKVFDKVASYNGVDQTFLIWSSAMVSGSTHYYLNQLGGTAYNAAGVYASAAYSRWHFSEVVPEKLVTLKVTPTLKTLPAGKTAQLSTTVMVNGAEATDCTLSWSTSDASVATVSEGTITAVSKGTVTVTATLTAVGGTTLQNKVTVEIPVTVG